MASVPGGIGVSSFLLVDVFMIAFYSLLKLRFYVPDVTVPFGLTTFDFRFLKGADRCS
jgi:hypothetical protein